MSKKIGSLSQAYEIWKLVFLWVSDVKWVFFKYRKAQWQCQKHYLQAKDEKKIEKGAAATQYFMYEMHLLLLVQ